MRQHKSLKRNVRTRNPKKKIFLFAEGEKTEPLYFKAYERIVSSSVIELVCEEGRGVPKTLLKLAEEKKADISTRSYKRDNGDEDQVWVAFDRDEHHEVERVRADCALLDIGVVFSNPCFEVWLILHVEDYDKDEHRRDAQRRCEEVCAGYSRKRHKTPDFSKLLVNVQEAELRADQLRDRRSLDGGDVPFTSAQLLTRAMREK